jgi:hypothetical protein
MSCAPAPPGSPVTRPSPTPVRGAAAAAFEDDAGAAADAGLTTRPEEAIAGDGGTELVAWDEDKCRFPPAYPPEGATAKECCQPTADVSVCVETTSLIHNHAVGPYTERRLIVTGAGGAALLSLPLDRREHGSMRRADTTSVALAFRVRKAGLEASLRHSAGCKAPCVAARNCAGEAKRVADICESAGSYAWDGRSLTRASTATLAR